MSLDAKNKIAKLTYFGNLTTKYCDPKKGQKTTFHDTIQGSKDFIFNFFDSQPYFNELMPTIIRNNRGTHFYKKIIKKGLDGKTDFFKNILKAIQNSQNNTSSKNKDGKKIIRYYKIPRLELLKKRKENLDKYLLKKNKTTNNTIKSLKKNKSMIEILNSKNQPSPSSETIGKSPIGNNTLNNFNNTNYMLNSTISGDTFHTNFKKNESMMNFHNKYSLQKKIPSFYITRGSNSSFREINNNFIFTNQSHKKPKKIQKAKIEKLLNKCDEGLNLAVNIGDNMEKLNKNKLIQELNRKIKNELKNVDQKVIEEGMVKNKKYQMLEKKKFTDLKRKMDIKISDDYAYINRKEYNEFMKDNDTIFAYQIYLKEMNKINEKIAKKREIEKKNDIMVKDLLDNTFNKKEFLKYKIDNYYTRYAKQDELKIFNFKNKDDFYINKNNDKEELKGTLLPKIFELKEYCYGRTKYDPKADI